MAARGTKVEMTVLFMGMRMHMIERTVEERHNEDGSTDWRWDMEGAMSGWLACHHEPRGEGTEVTTEFEYAMPGSVLGKVADRLLVEKRMRRDFENSLENLKLLAEAGVAPPVAARYLNASAARRRTSCTGGFAGLPVPRGRP